MYRECFNLLQQVNNSYFILK